ncbi:hypothetical protein BCV71DRAFT_269322 [Rhizopus microsporus]|uniref:Uncharacterized protein n=1 Tax=Rhizopus microsporus TaxID=58291 RepID=A0A1X0RJV2_RHIZD|nr:hypothetical protein BCV71DRAFT_269322 [Rhizopus microsporus]
MEQLLQKFQDLKVSKSTVYNFVRTECNLSLKKTQFQPVNRNSGEKIQERFDWVHSPWQHQIDIAYGTRMLLLASTTRTSFMSFDVMAWLLVGFVGLLLLLQDVEEE